MAVSDIEVGRSSPGFRGGGGLICTCVSEQRENRMSTRRLERQVALITGGCSGIGLATAELFLAEGASVVVADIQAEKGASLEQRFPDRLRFVHCDVTKEADIGAAVAIAARSFGGLDVLCNNAGTGGTDANLIDLDAAVWDEAFAVLLRAVVLGMKHAVPLMLARGSGSIINTASVAGLQAGWAPLAYSTAKAAVIHLTRLAAAELSPRKIRVNAICPGLIATSIFGAAMGLSRDEADRTALRIRESASGFQPIPKPGLPQDVAQAALYLASEASAFVSGTHLIVDGGITVGPRHSWSSEPQPSLLEAMGLSGEPR